MNEVHEKKNMQWKIGCMSLCGVFSRVKKSQSNQDMTPIVVLIEINWKNIFHQSSVMNARPLSIR